MSGYIISILIRIKPECVELVMEKTAVGDWFLLYLLGQNIDHIVFKVTRMVLKDFYQLKASKPAQSYLLDRHTAEGSIGKIEE